MSMAENARGLFGAAFGPVVLLSLFRRRFNYTGACADIVVGALADIAWLLCFTRTITDPLICNTGIYEILPGFIAGGITAVVISLLTKAPSPEVERLFASANHPTVDDGSSTDFKNKEAVV